MADWEWKKITAITFHWIILDGEVAQIPSRCFILQNIGSNFRNEWFWKEKTQTRIYVSYKSINVFHKMYPNLNLSLSANNFLLQWRDTNRMSHLHRRDASDERRTKTFNPLWTKPNKNVTLKRTFSSTCLTKVQLRIKATWIYLSFKAFGTITNTLYTMSN